MPNLVLNSTNPGPLTFGSGYWMSGVYRNRRSPVSFAVQPATTTTVPSVISSGASSGGSSTAARPALGARDIQNLGLIGQPGSITAYYGWSSDPKSGKYILGPNVLGKFQADAVQRGITSGGNAGILKTLRNLPAEQGFVTAPQQAALNRFLDTGVAGADLNPKFAAAAYDYAIRAESRPKESGLFGKILKSLVGPAIGALALGPAGIGVASAAVGGAVGGAVQSAATGGNLKDIALSTVGGYGVGSAIGKVQSLLSGATAASSGAATGVSAGDVVSKAWQFTPEQVSSFDAAAWNPSTVLPEVDWSGQLINAGSSSTLLSRTTKAIKGAGTSATKLLDKAGPAITGYAVASAITAGTGAAVAAGVPTGLPEQAKPGGLQPVPLVDADVVEADRLRRRRRATATDLTWGKGMTGELYAPTLLGAPTRLAA